jgi:hypothetical protein
VSGTCIVCSKSYDACGRSTCRCTLKEIVAAATEESKAEHWQAWAARAEALIHANAEWEIAKANGDKPQ